MACHSFLRIMHLCHILGCLIHPLGQVSKGRFEVLVKWSLTFGLTPFPTDAV